MVLRFFQDTSVGARRRQQSAEVCDGASPPELKQAAADAIDVFVRVNPTAKTPY